MNAAKYRHPFPSPYPGESIYSLLCRYHVRSGNSSAARTRMELFGNSNIRLTPSQSDFSLLDYSEKWKQDDNGTFKYDLLIHHTAYNLGSMLFQHPHQRTPETKGKNNSHPVTLPQKIYYPRIKRMRYCPACAAAEKKLYGEPYWHFIHQLRTSTHCPIHKIMLVDADVTYQEASYSFQPAFKAIGSKSSPLIPYQGCAFQTGIESDYLWIISNGSHLPDHDTICRKCYKTFQKAIAQSKYADWDLIDIMKYAYRALQAEKRKEIGESLWEQLLLTSHLYRPTISSKKGMICFGSIGELILYMRLIYGGAENYYRKEHLNGNMTYETYWSKISDLTLHRNHYY